MKHVPTLLVGLFVLGAGCTDDGAPAPAPVTLSFAGMVGNDYFSCGASYDGLGTAGSTLTLNDFRFYVSNVRLVDADGHEEPVALEQDGMWQVDDVALLDFENGCGEGNPEMNLEVVGEVPAGDYVGVRFDVGVPFELNHQNSAAAPAPLNLTSMFWSWAGGYKFVRVDGDSVDIPGWRFHLGSTGCEGDPMAGGVTSCAQPNRASVSLDGFDPESDVIIADLAMLVDLVDLSSDTNGSPGCMSGLTDLECEGYFHSLGLPFDGAPAPAQTFFRLP